MDLKAISNEVTKKKEQKKSIISFVQEKWKNRSQNPVAKEKRSK